MEAREAWKIVHQNRRNIVQLEKLKVEYFESQLREVQALREAHLERAAEAKKKLFTRLAWRLGLVSEDDRSWLLKLWDNEIRIYLDFIRRIDDGIMCCETRIAKALPELQ